MTDEQSNEPQPQQLEVVILGITRGLNLMIIFVVAFLGASFAAASMLFDSNVDNMARMIVGGVWAIALFGVIYGCNRYWAEQVIHYVSANYYYVHAMGNNLTENDDDESEPNTPTNNEPNPTTDE